MEIWIEFKKAARKQHKIKNKIQSNLFAEFSYFYYPFRLSKIFSSSCSFESMYNDGFLNKKLKERKQQNAFRQLCLPDAKVDFCSNDYLGIVKNNLLCNQLQTTNYKLQTGSTGSRLLAGNYELIEETEKQIAAFHQSETALIFNSGYDANTGVLSSVPQRDDTILYDALSHASIRDGIRLSFAQSFPFAHNDLNDLEKKLQQSTGNIFVVTESVFSMDGDRCPLQ
ncbi:MAG: pyridoxal phosphate-dependent aminotransferase family protein, partial [Parafilimonas sp.]